MNLKQMFFLLIPEPEMRRRLWWLLGGFVVMGGLEVAGIGSILPFMMVLTDPQAASQFPLVQYLPADPHQRLLVTGLACVVLVGLTNAFMVWVHWRSLVFAWDQHDRLSRRLLVRYLRLPLSQLRRENPAVCAKDVLSEAWPIVGGILVPALTGLARAIVVLGLLVLLAVIHLPLTLSVLGFLGGAYALAHLAIRPRLGQMGQERHRANADRFRAATETLAVAREIKMRQAESLFIDRFSVASSQYSKSMAGHQIALVLPKKLLELIAFGGFLLLLVVLGWSESLSSALALAALFGFATYRLLPAMQGIYEAVTSIRVYRPALVGLLRHLVPDPVADSYLEVRQPIKWRRLELVDVCYRHPGGDFVLGPISLSLPRRGMVALMGPTGCGKSTLLDILVGLVAPDSGRIDVDGVSLSGARQTAWRRSVGYVPQEVVLLHDTVRRNVVLADVDEAVEDGQVRAALEQVGLGDLLGSWSNGLETRLGEAGVQLSGGQRQRLGLARVLCFQASLLVLDEPTGALDTDTEVGLMETLAELARDRLVFVTTHRERVGDLCDLVLTMRDGRVNSKRQHSLGDHR